MAGANQFELVFDNSQVQAAILAMAATPKEVSKASDRAARHTMNAMKTLIARSISAQLNLPVNVLKSRLNVRKYGKGSPSVWVLWVGLNAMPVQQIGNISQAKAGLRHKGGIVKGGFDKDVFSSGQRGWIRKSRAKALGLKLPGLDKAGSKQPPAHLLGRFPVVRIATDLGAAAQTIINQWQAKSRERFLARFRHELSHIKGMN